MTGNELHRAYLDAKKTVTSESAAGSTTSEIWDEAASIISNRPASLPKIVRQIWVVATALATECFYGHELVDARWARRMVHIVWRGNLTVLIWFLVGFGLCFLKSENHPPAREWAAGVWECIRAREWKQVPWLEFLFYTLVIGVSLWLIGAWAGNLPDYEP